MVRSAVLVVALAAGSALAGSLNTGPVNQAFKGQVVPGNVNVTGGSLADRAIAPINVAGLQSWDAIGDANNTVLMVDVAAALGLASGTPVTIDGIGWDVTIQTTPAGPFGGSWLSEAVFDFDGDVFLTTGVGDDFPGTGSYTSGGIVDLTDAGVPDIVLANGVLRLELFESFDDSNGEVDANYLAGSTLFVSAVPAPSAVALLGLGGLVAGRRRR